MRIRAYEGGAQVTHVSRDAVGRALPVAALSPPYVVPSASRNEFKVLLRELKAQGRTHVRGTTRAARWNVGRGDS